MRGRATVSKEKRKGGKKRKAKTKTPRREAESEANRLSHLGDKGEDEDHRMTEGQGASLRGERSE